MELARKLAAHSESEDQLNALLDELERAGHLSNARFAESLVQRRAPRFGLRRIEQEIAGHQVGEEVAAAALWELRGGERERALAVWTKRFGTPPADFAARGRQHRFLAQRGFDGETIAWVIRQAGKSSTGD